MPIQFGERFSFDQSARNGDVFGEPQREHQTRVLILGAGLAGLTCALRYAQGLGRPAARDDVMVLEREPSVGGRVRSLKIESNVLNLGAVTFQPTAYPRYMALVDELGLRDKVRIIPRREMVLGIDGRVMHANNLGLVAVGLRGLVGQGVFSPTEAAQLLRFYFYMRRVTSPRHFDELLALHDRSVSEWAAQFGFSEGLKRKFIELFIAFTFSAPETISAAFGVLLLGFNLSHPANLIGGMMQVPEAIAARLDGLVETNARALAVTRDADGFVTRYVQDNVTCRVRSKKLVVAIPANTAAAIVREMRERAQQVVYGSGSAMLLHGKATVPGNLHLWRAEGNAGPVIYGGEAQSDGQGGEYFNVLTYRGTGTEDALGRMFQAGRFEKLLEYRIAPAVAAPQPNQKPLPLDWGDGLYLAGDCTGIFPSQEAAVDAGERVAEMIRN